MTDSDTFGTPSAEMKQLLQSLPPPIDFANLSPAEARAVSTERNQRWNRILPEGLDRHEVVVPADPELGSGACRMVVHVPPDAGGGVLIFIHGGGFVFCSPETHERFGRELALESGLPVALPDYRLSPEHPYPAALNDTVACLRAVFSVTANAGVRAGPLLVSGESAGANLCVAAMLRERSSGQRIPDAGLLFYGVYDADFSTPSYRVFENGPGLSKAVMRQYWDWYEPDPEARRSPYLSPMNATDEELRALPPLYMLAAEVDPLLSENVAFCQRLRDLGRDETLDIARGLTHPFLQMTNELAGAREALKRIGKAARDLADRAGAPRGY